MSTRLMAPVVTRASAVAMMLCLATASPRTAPAATSAAVRLDNVITGVAAGDQMGFWAGSAGDVNGDGFDDVVVSARFNDAGGADAGRAYVFFGGINPDNTADLTLTGESAGDWFGMAATGAGDVNGDGYADIVIGAMANDAGGSNAGRAYIFFGGSTPDAVADVVLTGTAAGDFFGESARSAGDVDGDGFDDVIVGAAYNNTAGSEAGRAYVYLGGAAPDAVADLILTGEAAFDHFGVSVGSPGDVNGDGYSDFMVGAESGGPSDAGRVYLFLGGRPPNVVADLVLDGEASGDTFATLSTGGDVNGDGFDDMIVGALNSDAAGTNAGKAYVYYGSTVVPNPGIDASLTGEAAGDLFGFEIGSAGDVNRDGFADIIVGSFENDERGTGAGRTYVYLGGPAMSGWADFVLEGESAGDGFGRLVSSAGDFFGDGFADVIVGAWMNDVGGADAGRAYIYNAKRYHVVSPNGSETWQVGSSKTFSWRGAELADLWLSVDGGRSYDLLRHNVGGSAINALSMLVPHAPTKFARIKVTPINTSTPGEDESDYIFTIQSSVSLLSLAAAPSSGGMEAVVTWHTDPGPSELAGYRLERWSEASGWSTIVALTRESRYTDPLPVPGARYRLFAINGFGEELELGQTELRPLAALSAWPLPCRAGSQLQVSFATAAGERARVDLFDAQGRLVRRLAGGQFAGERQIVTWDGRDEHGQRAGTGLYFLRGASGASETILKVVVLP